jgi:hypothetical protein
MYDIFYITLLYLLVQICLAMIIGKCLNEYNRDFLLYTSICCFLIICPLGLIVYSISYAYYDQLDHSLFKLMLIPFQFVIIIVPWYLCISFLKALGGALKATG